MKFLDAELKGEERKVPRIRIPKFGLRPWLALSVFIVLLLPPCAFADEDSPGKNDLSAEVARMNQSVDELVRLLKEERSRSYEDVELQKLEIAVTYLSFRSRRIEAKEEELREKRRIRNRVEDLVAKIKEQPEQWEQFYRQAPSPQSVNVSFKERPSEYRIKMLEERIDILDHDIIKLETDIAQLSGELAELESFVQENLGLIR